MKKTRRIRVGRLFKKTSSKAASAVVPTAEPTVEGSLPSSESKVEMTMATKPVKTAEIDVAALREEVELLELQVRKLQAREWLNNHRAKRVSAKKG